jgi:hypothetical protein
VSFALDVDVRYLALLLLLRVAVVGKRNAVRASAYWRSLES